MKCYREPEAHVMVKMAEFEGSFYFYFYNIVSIKKLNS